MTPTTSSRRFIDRHTAAWNRRDVEALTADHSENGIILSPMFARVEGRPQILASYTALFSAFPDWQLGYEDAICEGNRVAMPFSVKATHKGEFMGLPEPASGASSRASRSSSSTRSAHSR